MDEMKSPSGKLVEPLTQRERAILLHLAEEKSYAEIAAQEVVALSLMWGEKRGEATQLNQRD